MLRRKIISNQMIYQIVTDVTKVKTKELFEHWSYFFSGFSLVLWLLEVFVPGRWTGLARWVWRGPARTARTAWPPLRWGRTAAAAWCERAPDAPWSCSSEPHAAQRWRASGGRWGWLQWGGGGERRGRFRSVFILHITKMSAVFLTETEPLVPLWWCFISLPPSLLFLLYGCM